MRRRFLAFATVLAALGGEGVGSAQDGLRSPVLPDRSPSSARTDVFAVGPDYYRRPPEPRRQLPVLLVPYTLPGPYWYPPLPDLYREPGPVRSAKRRGQHAGTAAARPAASPPQAPGPPKTFYVIPGCYAGDRRPEPERLPAGCDLSRLKVVPPR